MAKLQPYASSLKLEQVVDHPISQQIVAGFLSGRQRELGICLQQRGRGYRLACSKKDV